ncbi:MAG: two-component sensor histidine kinase [Planctomycetaceae bacterium]|nr:two-component sensor histidine kinase [Planctomycetaceae bacterium]
MPTSSLPPRDDFSWQLPAEAITVRIRWFGLCVGYLLVNVVGRQETQAELNAILTLGACYALVDTIWGLRGKVFLNRAPLFISLMEAVFIGLLCYFDHGLDSLFRFYYFLSLLVCAIRYTPRVTYATFALHALSFTILAAGQGFDAPEAVKSWLLMVTFMGWVTWASTALVTLLKAASNRLSQLNDELRRNQELLEERIEHRTRELRESQALLVQQEKQAAFGLLAAGIAHEVGNPLAAISSLVQLMNRRELDDYMHERLGMIDEQLRRIQRTLRELVDFSRPASKDVTHCDIHEIVQSALNVAKYYKRKKGKQVKTQFADNLPRVDVIRDQMVQVFLNLVLNALDATEEGGSIQIVSRRIGGGIELEVVDDGHGIPPEQQLMLFEPYFTTKPTGTGLGLFVCRNMMEAIGGRIRLAESTPAGTRFIVWVPVREPASDSIAIRAEPATLPATATTERTALPLAP